MHTDWLPGKRADVLEMAQLWKTALAENNRWEDWDFLESEVIKLTELLASARFAFDRNNSPTRGPVTAAAAATAFKSLTAHMRDIKRRRFLSPPLTDNDWPRLGLRKPDNVRTEHTAVAEEVVFDVEASGSRRLKVSFWVKDAVNKAKPATCDGAVIVWGVSDSEPVNNGQLANHVMATRTPHVLNFTSEERGKTVWIALAWQNRRGVLGKWTDYRSAIVP